MPVLASHQVNDSVTVSAEQRRENSPVDIVTRVAAPIPGGQETVRRSDLTSALAIADAMPKLAQAITNATK